MDVIRTSVSVSRPRYLTGAEILAALVEPDKADWDKVSVAEAVLTEVSLSRLSELVRTGQVSWRQILDAASIYGLLRTDAGRLAMEMAGSNP